METKNAIDTTANCSDYVQGSECFDVKSASMPLKYGTVIKKV
ncbi:hypothetical protein [Halodesulfovibrio sp.]|nr:hypothetical protein [Halodesulfovibrio sp.]